MMTEHDCASVVTVAVTADMGHCCLYSDPATCLWQCHFNLCMYDDDDDDDDGDMCYGKP